MSILHTVNKSPFERSNLDSCLKHATAGDAILLLEDAVYAAAKGNAFSSRMADAAKQFKVFVLGPDLQARGVDAGSVVEGISVVDYGTFVDLAADNSAVQAWL
ncbi:MAG: sulfurtransferase complex subunit TusB [Solirubrobacterales bacterium]